MTTPVLGRSVAAPVSTVHAVDRVHDRATGTVRGRLLPTRGGDRSVRPFNIAGNRRGTRAAALGRSQNQDANQALSLDLLSNANLIMKRVGGPRGNVHSQSTFFTWLTITLTNTELPDLNEGHALIPIP